MSDSIYKKHWDLYATRGGETQSGWPGDEWGSEESWQRVFKELFVPYDVEHWLHCIEIGCGSGKYTVKVLQASDRAKVIAADISPVYQQYCKERLTAEGLIDRASLVQLDCHPATLMKSIEKAGLRGQLDALYSIDAMVHVDLQHLFVYLVTAAFALKPNGKLILTLANSTSDGGFDKLLRDASRMFRLQHQPTAKFEWMSPDMVSNVLSRLGFSIDKLTTTGRDILVVASKAGEPEQSFEKAIK
jgi:cyclopropane fatty-acyl-phospholipid synthase-like methyltransferase